MADKLLTLLKSGQRYSLSTIPSRLQSECISVYSAFVETNMDYTKWVWRQYSVQLWNQLIDCTWMSLPSRLFQRNVSTYHDSHSARQFRSCACYIAPLILLKWWMIPIYVYCFPSTAYSHITPEFLGSKLSSYAEFTKAIRQLEGYIKIKENAKTKSDYALESLTFESLVATAKIFRKEFIQSSLLYTKAYLPFTNAQNQERIKGMRSKIVKLLDNIRNEDKLILNDGFDISSFPIWKLQQIVSDRGMIVYQKNREDMEKYLDQWLALSKTDSKCIEDYLCVVTKNQGI
jgi:hypothetical protein